MERWRVLSCCEPLAFDKRRISVLRVWRLYEGRPIQKFWVLETVARLPYFSYITVLHLYESLGWWRTPQLRAVHNAEDPYNTSSNHDHSSVPFSRADLQEDNELHHLLIMEALGGGCQWCIDACGVVSFARPAIECFTADKEHDAKVLCSRQRGLGLNI
eukprot:6464922-Amphidinium_carterae.1